MFWSPRSGHTFILFGWRISAIIMNIFHIPRYKNIINFAESWHVKNNHMPKWLTVHDFTHFVTQIKKLYLYLALCLVSECLPNDVKCLAWAVISKFIYSAYSLYLVYLLNTCKGCSIKNSGKSLEDNLKNNFF